MLGADAIGLVFYKPSPRHVEIDQAQAILAVLPPFVTVVALFVDAEAAQIRQTLEVVRIDLLQFHGDEGEAYCRQFDRPYVKAARMKPGIDLLQYASAFPSAQAILLDAFVEGFGGGGKVFDWNLIPSALPKPLILSGGLDAGNVGEAISRVKPAAVDVSSGVEAAKGIKDAGKIHAFVSAVCAAEMARAD